MKRQMNREEQITEAYLRKSEFKDVVFEPDGNIPPDFSVDGKIAVEVRRLNQHFFTKDEIRGLEETRIPLFKLLESSLSEFDSEYKGYSYWVSIRFYRPVEKSDTNKKAIVKTLTDFLSRPLPPSCDIKVTENIYFHIYPSQAVEGRVFRFAEERIETAEDGHWLSSKRTSTIASQRKRKRSRTTMTNIFPGGLFWWIKLRMSLMRGKKTM
jgi:hypothetical protein